MSAILKGFSAGVLCLAGGPASKLDQGLAEP